MKKIITLAAVAGLALIPATGAQAAVKKASAGTVTATVAVKCVKNDMVHERTMTARNTTAKTVTVRFIYAYGWGEVGEKRVVVAPGSVAKAVVRVDGTVDGGDLVVVGYDAPRYLYDGDAPACF